jgi:hypothetical protein
MANEWEKVFLTNSSQLPVLKYTAENETEYRGATYGKAVVEIPEIKHIFI